MEKKNYSNGTITVVWQPKLCTHSGFCVRGLNTVFNTKISPWINMEGAETDAIIDQVKKCPSGALTFFVNADRSED